MTIKFTPNKFEQTSEDCRPAQSCNQLSDNETSGQGLKVEDKKKRPLVALGPLSMQDDASWRTIMKIVRQPKTTQQEFANDLKTSRTSVTKEIEKHCIPLVRSPY